jgi:hypothetical protein
MRTRDFIGPARPLAWRYHFGSYDLPRLERDRSSRDRRSRRVRRCETSSIITSTNAKNSNGSRYIMRVLLEGVC